MRHFQTPAEAAHFAQDRIDLPTHEWFAMILWHERLRPVTIHLLQHSQECPMHNDLAPVIETAVTHGATAILTVRYHPHQGQPPLDRITQRITELLDLMEPQGLLLFDHLVLSHGALFSARGNYHSRDRLKLIKSRVCFTNLVSTSILSVSPLLSTLM